MPEVTEKSRIEQENQSHGRACRRVRFFEQEYDGAGCAMDGMASGLH